MEVIDEKVNLADVANALRGGPDPRDPSGVHVTDLYWEAQRIAKGKEKPDYSDTEGLAEMGFLWEFAVRPWIRQSFPNDLVIFSPVYELEGVKATLDAVAIPTSSPVLPVVIDAKVKFGKLSKPSDRPDWLWQQKTYCKIVGTSQAKLFYLNILSGPPRCIAGVFHLVFTEEEIAENWSTVLNTKACIGAVGSIAPQVIANPVPVTSQEWGES